MNKQNNIIKPFILKKKINDRYNIIPLNNIKNTIGLVKHFPATTKEWCNSVYSFNKNSLKYLTTSDKNLSKIIKSYFNFYIKKDFFFKWNKFLIFKPSRELKTRFRRLAVNKVFISKAELKHTSSNVNITLYIFNQERLSILKKINQIHDFFFTIKGNDPYLYNISNDYVQVRIESLVLNLIETQLSILSIVKGLNPEITNSFSFDIKEKSLKIKDLAEDITAFILKNTEKKRREIFSIKQQEQQKRLNSYIYSIAYFKLLLNLNKFKFEDKFLLKLKPLIGKLYNKEVDFNIINLRSLYFNSDIFTQIIALKLRNNKNRLLKVLKTSLSIVKLGINDASDNYYNLDRKKLWANKIKNIRLNAIINKSSSIFNSTITPHKDIFNKVLSLYFLNSSFISKNVNNKLCVKENNNISIFVLNLLKHKKMAGVRLEAKGRLTKRFTASRSVFKLKWKGTLKNIDSTHRRLSTVILRGNIKSNIQYSIINSKTRNGSFGLKGWIGGK